jgi:hypothetical protein
MAENTWQRRQKWASLVSNSHHLPWDADFRERAYRAAREKMQAARANIEMLVERLSRLSS